MKNNKKTDFTNYNKTKFINYINVKKIVIKDKKDKMSSSKNHTKNELARISAKIH